MAVRAMAIGSVKWVVNFFVFGCYVGQRPLTLDYSHDVLDVHNSSHRPKSFS